MSLLPKNTSLKDQQFAELLDGRSQVNYSDLKIDPLTCNISLLPHLAIIKGANIDNMAESEARTYLKTFSKKANGTVGAVEDAVNVLFDNAQLVEWFEDKERFKKGQFGVSVDVRNDDTKYDERLFSVSNRLIRTAKNVRSKFMGFDVKYPLVAGNISNSGGAVINIKLKNHLSFNGSLNLNITGGVIWTV